MKFFYITLISISLNLSGQAYAQDHQSSPLRESDSSALNEKQARYKFRSEQSEIYKKNLKNAVSQVFIDKYKNLNSPKIAIFWNVKFDDQLREWDSAERDIVTKSGSASATGQRLAKNAGIDTNKNEPISDSMDININFDNEPSSFDEEYQVDYESSIIRKKEIKRWKSSRGGLSDEKADFEFISGFTSILLRNKVSILDRSMILRLTDNKTMKKGVDYQLNETSALEGYADYLAEILMTPDEYAPIGMSFLITIKDVSTGAIVAMLSSDGELKDLKDLFNDNWYVDNSGYNWVDGRPPEQKWVIGPDGYKVIDLEPSPKIVGQQLAIELISELNSIW